MSAAIRKFGKADLKVRLYDLKVRLYDRYRAARKGLPRIKPGAAFR